MSKVATLAEGQLTAVGTITIGWSKPMKPRPRSSSAGQRSRPSSIPDASPTQRPGSRGSSPRPRHGSPRSGRGGGKGKRPGLVPAIEIRPECGHAAEGVFLFGNYARLQEVIQSRLPVLKRWFGCWWSLHL